MSSPEPAVTVEHLGKRFRIFHERHQSLKQSLLNRRRSRHEDYWALDDVSFEVYRGETFAVIGHNGSGKSTLLKCLTGILRPDRGRLSVVGSTSALLELGAGFHPELTGRENVFLNAAILGLPRREVDRHFDDIVDFSGLGDFIDTPVKNYSSGMYVRLGFAVAINVDPDVLIIDEVLAVGDAEFQARCGDKIAEFRERGKTILLVTHGLDDVPRICQRAAWLDHGRVRMVGRPDEVVDAYETDSRMSRPAEQHEGGERRGSGEVRIGKVELVGPDGSPAAFAKSGDRFELRMVLQSDRPVLDPRLKIAFWGQNGVLVSAVSTDTRGHRIPVVDGEHVISMVVDSLSLLEGTYWLSLRITDSSGQRELDVRTQLMRFDVLPGRSHDEGLVSLQGVWR